MSKAKSGGLEGKAISLRKPPKVTPRPSMTQQQKRRAECAELHRQGLGWMEIANRLGYSSWQAARDAYGTWLTEACRWEHKDYERRSEMGRLEYLMEESLAELHRYDRDKPENFAARDRLITRLLNIHDRKVKLLGLSVPQEEQAVEHHTTSNVRIVAGSPADYINGLMQIQGASPTEIIDAMAELESGEPPRLSEEARQAHIQRNRPRQEEVEEVEERSGK